MWKPVRITGGIVEFACYMCVCVHVCTCIWIHTCMHTYLCVYAHIYTHIYTNVYIPTHLYIERNYAWNAWLLHYMCEKIQHSFFFFFFKRFIYGLIDWLLCWVFVSVLGLSLVAASGGHSSLRCAGLSLSQPLSLGSTGSRHAGSVVVAHGPSCSAACGIFPDRGSNPYPLH